MHPPSFNTLIQILAPGTCFQGRYQIVRPLGKGGMGHIFEVQDVAHPAAPTKVLKILHDPDLPYGAPPSPDMVRRFRQEIATLKKLDFPGIPKIFPEDDYFCETHTASDGTSMPIHGLVMEKIIGTDLGYCLDDPDWILTEDLALDWLEQLTRTLDYLHQNQIIHRDIKPNNIMYRATGELVLVDFGISRKMTDTYHARQQLQKTGTVYGTRLYAPPEQTAGKAVIQSDFFALGRTIAHLLSKVPPPDDPTVLEQGAESYEWYLGNVKASPGLRRLLNWMMEPLVKRRPRNTTQILRAIAKLKRDRDPAQRRRELPWVILGSIAATALTIGIRSLGWLQPLELAAFDHFMRLRPAEPPDPRITLITIDENDLTWQRNQEMQSFSGLSLADEALRQLLEKLEEYDARVVGLDLYRDVESESLDPRLLELMGSNRLIALCKATGPDDAPSIPPPQGANLVGFSDFYPDQDDIVRRQVLSMTPPSDSKCPNQPLSFSSQIIFRYLHDNAIVADLESNKITKIGAHELNHLQSHFGGYRNTYLRDGEQIMINYRASRTPFDIANQIPLRTFLDKDISPELEDILPDLIRDKIVLIGVINQASNDFHLTPLGRLPGVVVHAHMTSQIISYIEDSRPVLWTLNDWLETLWIFHWALLSLYMSWLFKFSAYSSFGSITCTSTLAYCVCLFFFLKGGWLPIIPIISAMTLSHFFIISFCASGRYSWLLEGQK